MGQPALPCRPAHMACPRMYRQSRRHPMAATENLLEIKGLTKLFGGLKAVSDFGLTLKPGALAGIIGPNGAGKTTVFNMVSGLYVPTSGEIIFEGENVVGMEPHEITQHGIGRTF